MLTGQDERAQSEQRGRRLLHPDWWAGPGHAGGAGRVLLQVSHRVQKDEGESGFVLCRKYKIKLLKSSFICSTESF